MDPEIKKIYEWITKHTQHGEIGVTNTIAGCMLKCSCGKRIWSDKIKMDFTGWKMVQVMNNVPPPEEANMI